jgi:hypothetical protein
MNVVAQKADGLNRDYYWICVFVQSSLHSRIAHVKTKVGAVIKYGDCLPFFIIRTTTNMEEYVDLKGRMRAGRYARICVCLQRSTKYLFKFPWCHKLKASLHNKVGIVTAGSRQFGKAARFAELYGMMKPAVRWAAKRCMTIWKKHLLML